MANTYATIEDKKFFDGQGGKKLWKLVRQRFDPKLDEVLAADKSIVITDKNKIRANISDAEDNLLELVTTGEHQGLMVKKPNDADTYSIAKDDDSGDYAAVYHMVKYTNGIGDPVNVGDPITIIKDKFLKHSEVVVKSEAGDWGEAGTYMHFEMQNGDDLWANVTSLIEYVTSGSQTGDMVVVTVDPTTHKVTATITDGTITKAKLDASVQASLGKADSAVQEIKTGATSGTIDVDGTEVKIKDLGTAAYKKVEDFDAAGSAAAVLGKNDDAATAMTVHGVKEYASEGFNAIKALTDTEIETLISAADSEYDAANSGT